MAFITKDDLKQAILLDELNEIVRGDDAVIDMAIEGAQAEMRGYLYDTYDVDAIFAESGTDRHALLVRYMADITVYAIVAAVQAGQDVRDRKARYDRAINWLKMISRDETYADLPRRAATVQTHIATGSNRKRNNYID